MDAPRKKPDEKRVANDPDLPSRPSSNMATELQIRETIATVREALDRSDPEAPNLWVFFSNKNDRLLTIEGDLYFIACVLLEGDSTVSSYLFESSQDAVPGPRVVVTRNTGGREIYSCGTRETKQRRSVSLATNPEDDRLITLTEQDLAPRMAEFANWLMLSGAITRVRSFSTVVEIEALLSALGRTRNISIRELLALPGIDPALMLGSIAKGLASGALESDVRSKLLTEDTCICRGTRPAAETTPGKLGEGTEQSFQRSVPLSMPRNRRTFAHPELFANPQLWLKDETPDVRESTEHRRRVKAVQLYLFDRPYSEIQRETGFGASWVRKLFQHTLHGNGEKPIGLAGLARYRRLRPYTRTRELPKSNMEEGRKGGFAGAFGNLAARYRDEFFGLVEAEVLKKRRDLSTGKSKIREARVSWVDLHGRVREFLLGKGVGNDEYPFNTRDAAYSSLVTLCNAILYNRPIRWIESRGGKDAVRRAGLGAGKSSLISAQWLNQIVELDYQKCDSAAVIEVKTPKGTAIDVPVARWWAGAIVESFSEAIVATSDSFETQTTEDCVMELVYTGITTPQPLERLARLKRCPDGAWLPSQMISEYARQGWDVLKLDRAWAHRSTTALSAIIATVGCAVCYGAPRKWAARHLVERTFEKLTQAGPQNLPSTLGTGPKDGRKDNPDAQAYRYRFLQDDVCDLIKASARWINETGNEGVFWATPLATLTSAMTAGSGRYFPRPLPYARDTDNPLMWHTIPCKVEGDATKGLAPCVRVERTRFRGPVLSKAWHLVRCPVYLQVFRRDIRKARVLLANSGEAVCDVRPEDKWMGAAVSWRDHALIQKFGQIMKRHGRSPTPVHDFLDVKQEELSHQKTKITQKKRDATTVARIKRNAQGQSEAMQQASAPAACIRPKQHDVLGPAPEPGAMRRANRRG